MGWDGWKGWDGGVIQLAGCAKLLAGWDGSDGWSQPGYHSNPRVGSGSSSLSACTCVESRTRPRRTRTPTLRMRLALSFIVYVADCFGSVTSVTRGLLCLGSGFFLCLGSGCVARVSSFSDALALALAPLILGRAYAHRVRDGDVGDDPASEIEPWASPRPPPHHCQKQALMHQLGLFYSQRFSADFSRLSSPP